MLVVFLLIFVKLHWSGQERKLGSHLIPPPPPPPPFPNSRCPTPTPPSPHIVIVWSSVVVRHVRVKCGGKLGNHSLQLENGESGIGFFRISDPGSQDHI
jgi:hypothetical protein